MAKNFMKTINRKLNRTTSARMNDKLGINIGELSKKLMADHGFLKKVEFALFWQAMDEDDTDLSVYLHILIQHLLQHLSGHKKLPFASQVLLNTINFLTMELDLPLSKPVTEILVRWNKNKLKYESREMPAAKDVLSVLYKRLVEKTEALDSIIIQCHQFYSHDELAKIADYYENPTILHILGGRDKVGAESADKVFMWAYLKKICYDSDGFKQTLDSIIIKLKTITGTVYLLPKLAEISLLALIFIISQLVAYYRVPDDGFITKSTAVLKRFYLWPVPYGTQARDLLLQLKRERVAPGLSFLKRVWKESHLPQIVTSDAKSFRPIYYIFDHTDANALLMSNTMFVDTAEEWGDEYQVHTGVSPKTCAILLLHIIHNEIGVSPNLEKSVRRLNENEIILFYKQVMDIFLSTAEDNDPVHARKSRREALAEIAKELMDHAKEKDDDDDIFELPQDLPLDYMPDLPDLHHTGIVCDISQEEFPTKGQIASGQATYAANKIFLAIRNILMQLTQLTSQKDPITLRFVIAGGNKCLNASITAYASLYRHYAALVSGFNLEFYLAPFSRNNYAEWLARMDPWYNRHIYIPFQSPLFLAPSLDPATRPRRNVSGKITAYGTFYRELIESYAREADHSVRLMLWECHGWAEEPFTNTPDIIVPYCQGIRLGRDAERAGQSRLYEEGADDNSDSDDDYGDIEHKSADALQSTSDMSPRNTNMLAPQMPQSDGAYTPTVGAGHPNNGGPDDFTLNDPLHDWEYTPIMLSVEWEQVDMIGQPSGQIKQKDQTFSTLAIRSCPIYGEKGFPPSPNEEGVAQLYANVEVSAKKKTKATQEYRLLVNEPSQHIRSCTIQVQSGKDRFWVEIDDRLYGPFARIRVAPMVDPTTCRQVFIPIRCFFPIDSPP